MLTSSLVLGGLYLSEHRANDTHPHTFNSKNYELLAHQLFHEKENDQLINFDPLRQKVQTYLSATDLDRSFYFEFLPTGTNIRDGDSNQLVGASLMKIPIVMDLYKAVKANKLMLDDKVTVPDNVANGADPEYGSPSGLKPGDKLTLRDAAKIALTESDNTAAYTIFKATDGLLEPRDQALNNLDVETRISNSDHGNFVLIGSRSYSSFLKCLYFSCFLEFENSQAILEFLSERHGDDRIRAGVPDNITVASKIGSFSNITQSDCGIVYVPSRPYTICLMIDSDDETADKHIKAVSKMVYDYVSTFNTD